MLTKLKLIGIFLLVSFTLLSCTTVNYTQPRHLSGHATWAIFPFTNYTETPLAGERASSITAAILRGKGVRRLRVYESPYQAKNFLPGAQKPITRAQMLSWARRRGAMYAVVGTVTEWRYKVGIDGEPAAGVTLNIIYVPTGKVVYAASGGRSNDSHKALSYTGQILIYRLLMPVTIG
ncbi:MAG: penicillin-binding protein activator LpoB [Pseudomonadota bacterium]